MNAAVAMDAEVPGNCVPWLALSVTALPGAQRIKAQNGLGGSAEARGRAPGSSWSATLDGSWGSSSSSSCSRQVDGTTRYLLDGLSVIAQYAPDGARQAFYVQSLARIDEVLSVVNSVGKFWYQADALGSVYTLTTAAGDVRARGGYDVFGEPVAEYGSQVGQPFGFTGREHELDSGLVYARNRYLSPSTGRWDRADPIGQLAGPNYYAYVRSRPSAATDPTGLLSTMDMYAMTHIQAFLFLMADLGVIKTAAMVVTAAGVAYPIAQVISTTREDADATATTMCPPIPRPRPKMSYYRGLSQDDVWELALFGRIYSKFVRAGLGGFVEALDYFVPGVIGHPYSSDEVAPGIPSPFVGVTTNRALADDFSHAPPRPGHMTIRFTTTRVGIPSSGPFKEDEFLFFVLLGEPGEMIEVVAP